MKEMYQNFVCINNKKYKTLTEFSKDRVSNILKMFLGGTTHMHIVCRPDLEFKDQF